MSAHEPLILTTRRHGSWCTCWCGWKSTAWTSTVGAHLAFGQHLLESR
jgi:hypothetical protein